MSTLSLGAHLSLSPMSTQPSKKGRDHDGRAPQDPKIIQPLLKLNVRLPRVRVCSVKQLRGLVKPRNKLRKLCADDLCRGRLIEVAAGGLAERPHNLAHLLLGRGAQLGDDLLNQRLELLARNLRGQ